MATINDGGPAFPIPHIYGSDGCGLHEGAPGMTKREYFAAMAMQGLCSQIDRQAMNEIASGERQGRAEAVIARHLADALIAALATRKTEGA